MEFGAGCFLHDRVDILVLKEQNKTKQFLKLAHTNTSTIYVINKLLGCND